MDQETIHAKWQKTLAQTLQQDMSPALAALHKQKSGTLCPLSCGACGFASIRTRKEGKGLKRTCSTCGAVSEIQIPQARRAPNFRKAQEQPPTTEKTQSAPTEKPEEKASGPTPEPTPKTASVSTAKRQKSNKVGLERLLAQNRAREAETAASKSSSSLFFGL